MFDGLRDLMIEQSSPTEVIIFILVGVVVCMVLAFAAYVAIMLLFWVTYLRKEVRLTRVFLPSSQQIREYFGEYALAVSTSVLLSLTVLAKHDLVQRILAYDLGAIAAELSEPLLGEEEAEVGVMIVSAVVKPAIASGASEQATLLIKDVVLPRLERRGLARFITERNLVLCCIVLSVLYLFWLAWRRSQEPSEDPEYGRTLRGVFVLAVCVTVLLASPSLMADDRLAESAVAKLQKIAAADDEDTVGGVPVDQLQDRIDDVLAFSGDDANGDEAWQSSVSSLRAEVERLRSAMESCEQRCQVVSGELTALEDAIAEFDGLGASLANHESEFQNAIAALTARDESIEQAHERDLEGLAGRLQDDPHALDGLEAKIGTLEDMHRQLEERHQSDVSALANRAAAEDATSGVLIVHADPGVQYTLDRGSYAGPRCLTLSPRTYSIRTRTRGQNVLGPDGEPTNQIRIEAGKVTALWFAPGRRRSESGGRGAPAPQEERCPDLVVHTIQDPQWDAPNSIIVAEIRNAGTATAPASLARIVDPSTPQRPGGVSYNAVAEVPSLASGATATVTFRLPYWVYNPDALLDVTADYKGTVDECDENNNTKRLERAG